jgi:hypothetical protein
MRLSIVIAVGVLSSDAFPVRSPPPGFLPDAQPPTAMSPANTATATPRFALIDDLLRETVKT